MMLVSTVSIILIFSLIALSAVLGIWKKLSVTLTLAGGMVFIFVCQAILYPDLITQNLSFNDVFAGSGNFIRFHKELGFNPALVIEKPQYLYTIITAIFTHNAIFHLFFNIISLIFLGQFLEKKIGGWKLLLVFIISGVIGNLFTASLDIIGFLGSSIDSTGVGASGGLFGIMGCLFILYPNEKFFLRWPVWVITLAYFLITVLFWALSQDFIKDYHVGNDAHIGGLIGGILMGLALKASPAINIGKAKKRDNTKLKGLAKTKKLKEILSKIENEDTADVRKVWLEEFGKNLKCPHCGKKDMRYQNDRYVCRCGHDIALR